MIDSFDTVCIITVSTTSLYLHRSLGSCAWVDIHRIGYRVCVKVGARSVKVGAQSVKVGARSVRIGARSVWSDCIPRER